MIVGPAHTQHEAFYDMHPGMKAWRRNEDSKACNPRQRAKQLEFTPLAPTDTAPAYVSDPGHPNKASNTAFELPGKKHNCAIKRGEHYDGENIMLLV